MADIKNAYVAKSTVTVTLTSLANNAGRESTVVDNTTNKYLDALLRIQTNGQGGGTGLLEVYVYAALGDTVYTDGATGSDAAFTAANRLNAKLLGAVQMNAATGVKTVLGGIAALFGGTLPSKYGFIFINRSGATLSATGGDHVIEVQETYQTAA